jgi:hypothetical protein
LISISCCTFLSVTFKNVQKEIDINTEVLGIGNGEIVKVTDESEQKEIYINTEVPLLTIPNTSVLISISFCTLSSVTFTISLLNIPKTSVLLSISF